MIPVISWIGAGLGGAAMILSLIMGNSKDALAGDQQLTTWHYILGYTLLAVTLAILGINLVVLAQQPPGNHQPYLSATIVAAISILTQATIGTLMLLRRRIVNLLRWHRWVSSVVVLSNVLLGILMITNLFNPGLVRLLVGLIPVAFFSLMAFNVVHEKLTHRYYTDRYSHPSDTSMRRLVIAGEETVTLSYKPDDVQIVTEPRANLLETSLQAGIPHAHVCGGNARCSTCRVMILEGLEHCSPRSASEKKMARRLQFDDEIRLACQTRINGNVSLRRLVLDADDVRLTSQVDAAASPQPVGDEQQLAILFSDIRGFTTFAEQHVPYDVIHALNRYFQHMGRIIERHGGVIDNYMGDGLLALFAADTNESAGSSLRAVTAAVEMLDALDELNPYYETMFDTRFDIGIGIHYGSVVLGSVGMPPRQRVTAIGDAVNVASRIESANKTTGTHLLISQAVYDQVRGSVDTGQHLTVELPGKSQPATLYEVRALRAETVPA